MNFSINVQFAKLLSVFWYYTAAPPTITIAYFSETRLKNVDQKNKNKNQNKQTNKNKYMSSSSGSSGASSSKDKIDPNEDYYGLLNLTYDASVDDIRRAYKQLALRWHPDRNPERRAEAETMFDRIRRAHDILTDADAKSEYDVHVRSRRAEQERLQKMSAKRRHLKEQLEQRERMAREKRQEEQAVSEMQRQRERVGQVRKEGYHDLYEEYEKHRRREAKRQRRQQMTAAAAATAATAATKVQRAPMVSSFDDEEEEEEEATVMSGFTESAKTDVSAGGQQQQKKGKLRRQVHETLFPMPAGMSTEWTIPTFDISGIGSSSSDHAKYEQATMIRLMEAAERQRLQQQQQQQQHAAG